jgi:hypothetical protein
LRGGGAKGKVEEDLNVRQVLILHERVKVWVGVEGVECVMERGSSWGVREGGRGRDW